MLTFLLSCLIIFIVCFAIGAFLARNSESPAGALGLLAGCAGIALLILVCGSIFGWQTGINESFPR